MQKYISKANSAEEVNHRENVGEEDVERNDEVKVAPEDAGENEGKHEVQVAAGDDEGNGKNGTEKKRTFKYVDGVERLCDMELPFLVELPNGSCEAVFLTASNNNGCGVIPILEYVHGRQTIVDKLGGNGVFLHSHDRNMKAEIFKTTVHT